MIIWCNQSVRKTNFLPFLSTFLKKKVKVKVNHSPYMPGRAQKVQESLGSQFSIQHMKVVRFSALSTGRLYRSRKHS
jgi:hypothetical protein